MPDWRILISDGLDEGGQAMLRAAARVEDRAEISPAELLEAVAGCEALIVRSRTRVTAEVLAAASRLKVVGRAGVGEDNIDLEAAARCGVIVVNSPHNPSGVMFSACVKECPCGALAMADEA